MTDAGAPPIVVGLYSFPKSGNTWLRAIIAAAIGLPEGPGALQTYVTDTHYGPAGEHSWHFQGRDWCFYKSHHRRLLTESGGRPLKTDRVVYVYRHPLDVFVSYLNFVSGNVAANAGKSLPFAFSRVEDLTDAQMETLFALYLEHGTIFPQNRAFGGVFEHVAGFRALRERGEAVHILRYEDMIGDFAAAAEGIFDFLGWREMDLDRVFEAADGRTRKNGKFFWKRKKDNYRDYLSPDQIARFTGRWGAEMRALGYDAEGVAAHAG